MTQDTKTLLLQLIQSDPSKLRPALDELAKEAQARFDKAETVLTRTLYLRGRIAPDATWIENELAPAIDQYREARAAHEALRAPDAPKTGTVASVMAYAREHFAELRQREAQAEKKRAEDRSGGWAIKHPHANNWVNLPQPSLQAT